MKTDDQEVGQQQEGSENPHPVIPNGEPANNDRLETNEPASLSDEVLAEVEGKRSVSKRKIQANRRNAAKSTGPRTADGKKKVAMNALRHGFFAKGLLVQHRDGNEDQTEYDALYLRIFQYFQPVGWLEEFRVDQIAFSSWRLRRLLRCESGIITKALAENDYNREQSKADKLLEPESTPSSNPTIAAITDHLFLLPKEELDGLLQFEAMVHRQLNHALGDIERLQARRKVRPSLCEPL
jgi:hypothetical protein